MNEAHWHLAVNHLPIIIPVIGIIIMISGLFFKSNPVKRTAYMIFIIGALSTIAAMATGEEAEDLVEDINGFSENYIEHHEEESEIFAVWSYILGGISVLGLWVSFSKKPFSNSICVATIIFAMVTMYFAKNTATTGGEIRHTEIRSNSKINKHHD